MKLTQIKIYTHTPYSNTLTRYSISPQRRSPPRHHSQTSLTDVTHRRHSQTSLTDVTHRRHSQTSLVVLDSGLIPHVLGNGHAHAVVNRSGLHGTQTLL